MIKNRNKIFKIIIFKNKIQILMDWLDPKIYKQKKMNLKLILISLHKLAQLIINKVKGKKNKSKRLI
jgi:hypothetical protein